MCGIAGVHRRTDKPIPKIDRLVDELLLAIQPRGTDATGFLSLLDSGKVQLQKTPKPASTFIRERGRLARSARTVLLHTRFATVGSKHDPRNAHPVASGNIAAIHNGTIRNASELFKKYKLPRIGTVDSEIIPALVSDTGWGDKEIIAALKQLQGGAATAIVNTACPSDVILARVKNYPLVYAATDDIVIWASTEIALRQAWHRTYGAALPVKTISLNEGTVLRVNGSIHKLPKLPVPKTPVYKFSQVGRNGDLQAWADEMRRERAPKQTKHRGGRGMPRAFPACVPAVDFAWVEDVVVPVNEDRDIEGEILDLMSCGLTRTEAATLVAEDVYDEASEDFDDVNTAILESWN